MPTYEYQCGGCGHQFELFQPITAPPVRKCPACGKAKVRRLIGAGSGIIFRGSGFYQTDYRSESYRQAAKAEKEKEKASGEGKKEGAGGEKASSSTKPAGVGP